jgi:hypothetical protein
MPSRRDVEPVLTAAWTLASVTTLEGLRDAVGGSSRSLSKTRAASHSLSMADAEQVVVGSNEDLPV